MSSLKDKLYDFETNPPANAWEKIAAALDDSHLADKFPDKLYNQEATPPANAWTEISRKLNPQAEAPVIPMRRRAAGFIRYAAAAVVIFLVGYFIFNLSGGNENPSSENGMVVTQDTSKKSDQPSSLDQNNEELATINETVEPSSEENFIASTGKQKVPNERRTVNAYSNQAPEPEASEVSYAYIEHTPNLAERYVMFMNPSGNIIRMSKKWGDMVCCVSGEEQDEDCRDQLRKWQEKIATSPSTSTGGGFMDVLSIVTALENDL